MNSWSSSTSSLSVANWFSDDESLYVEQIKGLAGVVNVRKTRSYLDIPDREKLSFGLALALLPPIKLRNSVDRGLNTDSSSQSSARYSKKWKGLLGLSLSTSEWRLPHASAPARPDYSRVAPVSKARRSLRATFKPSDKNADDAGSPRSYASFVTNSLLHCRQWRSETRHSHAEINLLLTEYQIPGWCYGCRLEHGCFDDWHAHPSYDPFRDRPVRIGGGYAYCTRLLHDGIQVDVEKADSMRVRRSLLPPPGPEPERLPQIDFKNVKQRHSKRQPAWEEIRLPEIAKDKPGKTALHQHSLAKNRRHSEPSSQSSESLRAITEDRQDLSHSLSSKKSDTTAAAELPAELTAISPQKQLQVDKIATKRGEPVSTQPRFSQASSKQEALLSDKEAVDTEPGFDPEVELILLQPENNKETNLKFTPKITDNMVGAIMERLEAPDENMTVVHDTKTYLTPTTPLQTSDLIKPHRFSPQIATITSSMRGSPGGNSTIISGSAMQVHTQQEAAPEFPTQATIEVNVDIVLSMKNDLPQPLPTQSTGKETPLTGLQISEIQVPTVALDDVTVDSAVCDLENSFQQSSRETTEHNLEESLQQSIYVTSVKMPQLNDILVPSVVNLPPDQLDARLNAADKQQIVNADFLHPTSQVISSLEPHINISTDNTAQKISPSKKSVSPAQRKVLPLPGSSVEAKLNEITAILPGSPADDSANVKKEDRDVYSQVQNNINPVLVNGGLRQQESNKRERREPVKKTVIRKKVQSTNDSEQSSTITQDASRSSLVDSFPKTSSQQPLTENGRQTVVPSFQPLSQQQLNADIAKPTQAASQEHELPKVVKPVKKKEPFHLPALPVEKPNFMHLLSLGTTESSDQEVRSPTPLAATTPEMDFDIQKRSATPSPVPSEKSILQVPLLPIKPRTPTPPPKPVVHLPKPPSVANLAPPSVVIKKRQRALLHGFASWRKGAVSRQTSQHAEITPPTRKELKAGHDPVDYLTKYCLIHFDRLPYYERVFHEITLRQHARFESKAHSLLAEDTSTSSPFTPSEFGLHRLNSEMPEKLKRLLKIDVHLSSVPEFDEPAVNLGEFHMTRLVYTLQQLQEKYQHLVQGAEMLEAERDHAIADAARQVYPEILTADYGIGADIKKKKRARSSSPKRRPRTVRILELSDGQVLERLLLSQKEKLMEEKSIRLMTMKLERLEQRLAALELRANKLEAERLEMESWAKELFINDVTSSNPYDDEFRKKQTSLFNRLHPSEDIEMNLEELEYALQMVNNHLITTRERQYILHVLNVPGCKRINFKMFSCIAALSEKVHQLEPIVRRLINRFDYEALEIKMEACKKMFYMLADRSGLKGGSTIPLNALAIELLAGGLTSDTVNYVMSKLDFRSKGYVEYLDYLMYIPLFVEIHQKIVKHPLTDGT